ncbi:protein of unknown function [Methylocella tundrae]|uniref:Uncharacterized protein n=1 Tax=Methylocella tundrae TaxID=227605 RepID=A0A4U8Z6B6_METTU|nr:protein of unknown function [Methylocella tundrae]
MSTLRVQATTRRRRSSFHSIGPTAPVCAPDYRSSTFWSMTSASRRNGCPWPNNIWTLPRRLALAPTFQRRNDPIAFVKGDRKQGIEHEPLGSVHIRLPGAAPSHSRLSLRRRDDGARHRSDLAASMRP